MPVPQELNFIREWVSCPPFKGRSTTDIIASSNKIYNYLTNHQ
ncbi:hypothetical protein QUB70_07460 [Microcoleus sp. A003_D6]